MPRPLDVVLAGAGLVVASPLLAVAAMLIKLESRGPVFYRQRRVGRGGEPFELWKLRTMVPRAETMGDGIYVLEGDPRITRVGRVLRRFSLDELPNLVNVAKGDLALVGPRPTVQEQVRAMGADADELPDGFHIRGGRRLTAERWTRPAATTASPWRLRLRRWARTGPVTITGAEVVDVSYPGFFDVLDAIVREDR